MAGQTLHIVFNQQSADDLRSALAQTARDDQVIALPDNLSFGPINPIDTDARRRWIDTQLGDSDGVGPSDAYDATWRAALVPVERRVLWLSRRSAQEYAGFLAYLWRLGDADCEIIEITDLLLVGRNPRSLASTHHPAMSLALVGVQHLVNSGILYQAKPLIPAASGAYRATWQRLRIEDAALRIIDDNFNLVSVPLSFFDDRLLSYILKDWQKAAYVIGKTMAAESFDDHILQVGDSILSARLRSLAETNQIEARGDLFQIGYSEVRVPTNS